MVIRPGKAAPGKKKITANREENRRERKDEDIHREGHQEHEGFCNASLCVLGVPPSLDGLVVKMRIAAALIQNDFKVETGAARYPA
ncbi:MAG: hypothetical protein LBI67_11525, partial [Treponema sp.]|nr:hypothetical protein [Treponema sp.]